MVERICPACQHGNPMENRYCGACGASLEHNALATRRDDALVIAGQSIPLAQVRQVGRAVAVGLAAVAAEAGVAWLKRRAERVGVPTTALAVRPAAEPAPQAADPVANVVTIVSQRVVEIWDHGSLTRQIVEKHVWKKEG
ncbi:MAG TPA: zinc ribbon domain-containing protein [Chloroflexaceae bacterium]|nr:zinc ribbon domain-containing protein [Chloroflexaceae bacterium]